MCVPVFVPVLFNDQTSWLKHFSKCDQYKSLPGNETPWMELLCFPLISAHKFWGQTQMRRCSLLSNPFLLLPNIQDYRPIVCDSDSIIKYSANQQVHKRSLCHYKTLVILCPLPLILCKSKIWWYCKKTRNVWKTSKSVQYSLWP
jgi:hypothetical protein